MYQIYFLIYAIITLFIAIYLATKIDSSHKYITFILGYWILAHSVLSSECFIIDIKKLPFDLQPNRILLILFVCYLFLIFIKKSTQGRDKIIVLRYEQYLYLYILFSIILTYFHSRKIVTLKDFIVENTSILTFVVIYLVLKIVADKGMIKALCKAFLILCSASSIIGIIQFLFNPKFFRIGAYRGAFSTYIRSNGLFHAEYMQSYFLISGIILTLFIVRPKIFRYFFVSLFGVAIFFTFHRMSWITGFILIALYIFRFRKNDIWKMITVGVITGGIIFLVLFFNPFDINKVKNSALFRERLLRNTMISRENSYNMVLKNIKKAWLIGYGSKKSDAYYFGMLAAGYPKKVAKGEAGAIHNRFLEVMFFKGIIVFIIYCIFFISVINYSWGLARTKDIIFYIPLFETLKFVFANMTNSFSLSSNLGLLLAIFLGISVCINKNNITVNSAIEY